VFAPGGLGQTEQNIDVLDRLSQAPWQKRLLLRAVTESSAGMLCCTDQQPGEVNPGIPFM
jgi:hypothetical protein